MKPKVYLETSFISYLAGWLSEDLTTLQRQLKSRRWWELERNNFDLVVSQIVYEECGRGAAPAVEGRSAILEATTLLPLTREIMELAKRLVDPGPFPRKTEADAFHVAAATVYGFEFLLDLEFQTHQQCADEARGIEDH